MSGSYEGPPGRPPQPPRHPIDVDPYEDVVTGPPTGARGLGHTHPGAHAGHGDDPMRPLRESLPRQSVDPLRRPVLEAEARDDLRAPARDGKEPREQLNAPIVPAGSVTGRSLTLVITIMCFLACLTAGAVYMIHETAGAWQRDIASEVTVQVEPREGTDTDNRVREVSQFLEAQAGIARVRALPVEASSELLEPWLGSSDALKSLPLPRLIALELDRAQGADLDKMREALTSRFPGATLDDHRKWQSQIRTVTRSFALGGLAILLLVAAATTAIIVSATKSSMLSNREIVEVLHFVGATDRFIAREFEKHFLRLGIRAGFVGASLALLVFLAIPIIVELLGGGLVTLAEMHRMIGSGSLDVAGYVLLGIVVAVIAALCMVTSRIGVYRILNSKH